MSWITVIWCGSAAACLMLALVHGLIWRQRRQEALVNGLFVLFAVATSLFLACNIWLMRAQTVEELGRALRWTQVPALLMIVALVDFVRIYFRAGRPWLAWTICGVSALSLMLNFIFSPNVSNREIAGLRHIQFLGESVSVAGGVPNPWMLVDQAGLLLLVAYMIDATFTVWRRSDRPGARFLSSAVTFLVALESGQALLAMWGLARMPFTSSLFAPGIVLIMGFGLSYDVIRAMKLADDLKASELRLRTILEEAPLAISLSRDGINLYANQQFKALFGLQKVEQWAGSSVIEYYAPQCREEIKERIRRRSLGLPAPREYESTGLRTDGTQFPMQLTVAPIHLADGEASMGFVADITERKQVEEALRHSEGKYRKIFENVQDVFYQTDNEGIIIEISPSIERYAGFRREELIGKPVETVYYNPEDRDGLLKVLREKGEVVDYELQLKTKTGRSVYTSVNTHILLDSGGKPTGIEGSLRDITERKRGEFLAIGHQQVLEMIAGDAPIQETLKTLLHVIEMQADEMLCSILLLDADGIHLRHGAAPRLPEAYNKLIDGVAIGASVGSCGTAAFRRKQVIVEDIATDPLWENYRAAALPHGLLACWSTPIFDAQQKILGTFAVYYRQPGMPGERDLDLIETATHIAAIAISREGVKTALQASERQLRQSQKMEGIGQLAGGVAHDFNNILASTLMQVELVGSTENLPPDVKEGLQQIRADAERAANLTRQLLLFSRRQTMQPHILNLNEQVINLVKMLQRIIGEDIHLELHLSPAPLMTFADAGMLDQVLLNLVVNSRDAMSKGGRLRIETSEKLLSADEPLPNLDASPGHFVCLMVSDTGGGIPPEILPRIFEPFFTTKAEGKGTGLGLATVYGIVKQHRGWIQLENQPDKGVTFQIFLPASAAPVEKTGSDTKFRARRGTETILLVEDEDGLLNVTRKILERHGYQVLTASNGPEALAQWQKQHAGVALLLTDLVMPGGLNGQELGRRLRAEQPQLKVVYTSGYSADIAGRVFEMQAGESFIQKPFAPGQLLDIVRGSLDGSKQEKNATSS